MKKIGENEALREKVESIESGSITPETAHAAEIDRDISETYSPIVEEELQNGNAEDENPPAVEDKLPEESDGSETENDLGKGNTLWDAVTVETPEMADTIWNFSGACIDGNELNLEEVTETLNLYGGTLQFAFGSDGTAQMIQGGGTLDGTYDYLEDGSVCVTFDNNGTELPCACIFVDLDGLTMIAIPADESGMNGVYFVQK